VLILLRKQKYAVNPNEDQKEVQTRHRLLPFNKKRC